MSRGGVVVGKMVGIVAREIMGRPDAHLASMASLEREGFDGIRVELADAPLLLSGPHKGFPNWRKASNVEQRYITNAALEAGALAWATRTGGCVECAGDGRVFVRWSVTGGTTYRSCPKCNGTGKCETRPVAGVSETQP